MMPFLSRISLPASASNDYPFDIPVFKKGLNLLLKSNVTFFVGENGSGKSTLLEGIAENIGFNLRGGNKNHNLNTGINFERYESPIAELLELSWTPKRISNGFFMRAESFFNFASYIDEVALIERKVYDAYGGKSLHKQSHGESFLALFNNQFESGIYLLDEPEAALSPSRILTFLSLINQLETSGSAQFLIATHSPMLLCYPNATILSFNNDGLAETTYQETEHYLLTKAFLDHPENYFKYLFDSDSSAGI